MNNILVTGANGQLGSELRELAHKYPNYKFFFTDVSDLDITNSEALQSFVDKNSINTIFNCAAYTAVDAAEDNRGLADAINHLAVASMAKVCKERKMTFVHISTDYVFDGLNNKPYLESDVPNPKSVYGKTKLDGEKAIFDINPLNTLIIRTSWVYSSFGNNFVKTMLRLGAERSELSIVSDQVGSPTYAKNLAEVMLEILPKVSNSVPEILNYANEGVCSWFDFAEAIFEIKALPINVQPINTDQYPTAAKRPAYTVLSTRKIKTHYGIEIPHWRDALKGCLSKLD